MELNEIELPEPSYNDIAQILDQTFGDVTLANLNEETFIIFVANVLQAAYKIGVRDGVQSSK